MYIQAPLETKAVGSLGARMTGSGEPSPMSAGNQTLQQQRVPHLHTSVCLILEIFFLKDDNDLIAEYISYHCSLLNS